MDYRLADRIQGLSGSAIREIFKLLDRPGIISFAGGMPAGDGFPVPQLRQILDELMATQGEVLLQYGATEGYAPLKEVCQMFLQDKGVRFNQDEILITSGGQQAMDLLCRVLVNPGDTILVEQPTFLGALHTFKLHQANLVAVQTDQGGVILQDLEEKLKKYKPKLVYLIPTFQNPTGITTVLERRQTIAQLSAKYQAVVIEDDPYRDLRYHGEALPAIRAMDEDDAVVYCGSFSKVISPGLRVGYAVGNSRLIRAMAVAKQGMDVHTGVLSQALCAEFLARGLMPAHLAQLRGIYGVKLKAMLEAAQDWPQGVTVTQPQGGLFLWATLPAHMDAQAMFDAALAHHVAYVPGQSFHCDGSGSNTLRLNFSNASIRQIQDGMQALGDVIRQSM